MIDAAITVMLCPVCVEVQSFVRGRRARKRRDRLKAEGRAQSLPRDEMLPCKVKTGPLCQSSCKILC